MHRLAYIFIALALLFAGWLRLRCLPAEFWLDEIWSLELAREAGSPLGIFLIRHDNNHPLNAAWLLACPDGAPVWLYRLHVLVAGLVAVLLAARVAWRLGPGAAVLAAWLLAACPWLVLASVEARGYTLAVCFALLALDCLWRYLESQSTRALVGFWLASVAGFLAHLTFVHATIGFVVWSMRSFARQGQTSAEELQRLLRVHGPVAVFFLLFYLISVRGMEVGGGPPVPYAEILARLVSLGLGGPADGWSSLPWLLAALAALAVGLRLLARRGDACWVFFAVAVLASPALFLARRPPFLFERYFLIPFVFFLIVQAHVLASLWSPGRARRLAVVALALVFLVGSTWHTLAFAEAGRGQFQAALQWIAEEEANAEIVVTGDHAFRVRKYVHFHAAFLHPPRQVRYEDRALPARWLLVHRLDDRHPVPLTERDRADYLYRLVRAYPSRGRGCWGWFVYERVRSAAAPRAGDRP